MAFSSEPENGDFQKLAEQLASQSQTNNAIQQSVMQQANLEESKAKIQSEHLSTLNELSKENHPQTRMQGKELYQEYQTQTVKSSASQTAHSLHQRPQSAAEQAHALHQRPQSAAQTAHQLHTQPQGNYTAQQGLFSQTQNQAAQPNSAQPLGNPQLQTQKTGTTLTGGQFFICTIVSCALSVLLTSVLNLILTNVFAVFLPEVVITIIWLAILVPICSYLIARFEQSNRKKGLNALNNQQDYSAQPSSPDNPNLTTNSSETYLNPSNTGQISYKAPLLVLTITLAVLILAIPVLISDRDSLTSEFILIFSFGLSLLLLVPTILIVVIFMVNKKRAERQNTTQGFSFNTSTSASPNVQPNANFAQPNIQSTVTQAQSNMQANPSNYATAQQANANPVAGSQNPATSEQKPNGTAKKSNEWKWGALVISCALTAIVYGVLDETLDPNSPFSPIYILPFIFALVLLIVSILMRSQNYSRQNRRQNLNANGNGQRFNAAHFSNNRNGSNNGVNGVNGPNGSNGTTGNYGANINSSSQGNNNFNQK